MKPDFINLPKTHYFDYTYLVNALQRYRNPRDKISKMLKQGEIIRLKKGLYVLGPEYGGVINRNLIANALYGPSCLSLDSALSFYSLIPERVTEITSITPNRNKIYNTPVGRFSYQHVRIETFHIGMVYHEDLQGGYFIASKEKALCDKIMIATYIRTLSEIKTFLIDDLRIEEEALNGLDKTVLTAIQDRYKMKKINTLCQWLANFH